MHFLGVLVICALYYVDLDIYIISVTTTNISAMSDVGQTRHSPPDTN